MPADEMRLQKALAQAGVASRRAAEDLIRQGRVKVNGQTITELGTKVVPGRDNISVDDRQISGAEVLLYYALNKPAGYVSTAADPQGRPTVLDLMPSGARLYPVGRLDADTEGLLLMTNDGDFAYAVTHPKHLLEKEYRALVFGRPTPESLVRLRTGIVIEGRRTAPAEVEVVGREGEATWLRIVIHEGRKRQIRRMAEAVGNPVVRLRRVRVGGIRLGQLPPGSHRPLTAAEIRSVRGRNEPGIGNRD